MSSSSSSLPRGLVHFWNAIPIDFRIVEFWLKHRKMLLWCADYAELHLLCVVTLRFCFVLFCLLFLFWFLNCIIQKKKTYNWRSMSICKNWKLTFKRFFFVFFVDALTSRQKKSVSKFIANVWKKRNKTANRHITVIFWILINYIVSFCTQHSNKVSDITITKHHHHHCRYLRSPADGYIPWKSRRKKKKNAIINHWEIMVVGSTGCWLLMLFIIHVY